jgi:excisionase family DNA binding protein
MENWIMKSKSPAEVGRLFTLKEAQEALACGRTRLFRLHQEGQLEFIRLGKSTRITERSIRKLIHDLIETKTIAPKTDSNVA